MPEGIGGLAGYGLAVLVAIFAFFRDRRKADVDESAIILAKWKELVEHHEERLSTLGGEIESLRKRLAAAESRISELQADLEKERTARRKLEAENAGLKRAIAQNSKSTAHLLTANPDIEDDLAKLGQAGDNIRKAGK